MPKLFYYRQYRTYRNGKPNPVAVVCATRKSSMSGAAACVSNHSYPFEFVVFRKGTSISPATLHLVQYTYFLTSLNREHCTPQPAPRLSFHTTLSNCWQLSHLVIQHGVMSILVGHTAPHVGGKACSDIGFSNFLVIFQSSISQVTFED